MWNRKDGGVRRESEKMHGRTRKQIKMDNEKGYASMAGRPPDKRATEEFKRKPYAESIDVLTYLQKKYGIKEEKSNE